MAKPLQLASHPLANYPLKVLSQLEKNHKFDKLPNLKNFPSATRIARSHNKVIDDLILIKSPKKTNDLL